MTDETTSVWADIWAKAKAAWEAIKAWPKSVSYIAGFLSAIILKAFV